MKKKYVVRVTTSLEDDASYEFDTREMAQQFLEMFSDHPCYIEEREVNEDGEGH